MLKKSLSQGVLACAGTPFLLLWHARERLAISMRLSRAWKMYAAFLRILNEIFDIAGT
jgi:hypothetical protein